MSVYFCQSSLPQKMLYDLPKEVIFEILQYLNFQDLNNVSEASKYLHSLATDPSLWRNFDFRRKCRTRNLEVPISAILALPRFQKLKRFSAPYSSPFLEDMKEWGFSALVSIKQIADLERTEFDKIMENLQNMSLQEFVYSVTQIYLYWDSHNWSAKTMYVYLPTLNCSK